MNGGMRIDPKELPLRYQEQLGAAILAQFAKTPPVAVREVKYVRNIRSVRRLVFANPIAAMRYRILRKQAESGMICELLLHKNDRGLIDCFTYTITEEYGKGAKQNVYI